ncbi:hypothetical protein BJ165DRAFT_361625 [Panaeolus papilionaceus]|nr:hypothetical protein BJ165DRAFT_361625 [Panaeolus papilionaceus]
MTSNISDGEQVTLIDTKIAELLAQIGHLKTKINCYKPISALSPEIMRIIFLYVREACFHSEMHFGQWEWIQQVSHVCRSWRTTSLRYKELWSEITFDSPRCTELLLERSRPSPMSVILGDQAHRDEDEEEAMWNALREVHRMKSLQYTQNHIISESNVYLESFPQVSAPMLQAIRLERVDRNGHFPNHVPASLPPLFFGETPRLRHMEVQGWAIPWTHHVFNNLTELVLGTYYLRPLTFPGTPADFFDALERMPALRIFDLGQIFPPEMVNFQRSRTLQLRRMEDFRLKAPTTQCTAVLKNLAIPITASLVLFPIELIDGPGVYRGSTDRLELVDLVSAIKTAWIDNRLCTSRLLHEESPGGRLSIAQVNIRDGQFRSRSCVEVHAHIRTETLPDETPSRPPGTLTVSAAQDTLFAALPLYCVHSVEIGRGVCARGVTPRDILKHFPQVKQITLRDDGFLFLRYLSHITDPTSDSEGDKNDAVRCRNLVELTLDGVNYEDTDSGRHGINRSRNKHSIKLEELLDFLRVRCDLSIPIQRLRIVNSTNLERNSVECLQPFVVDLELATVKRKEDKF